MSLAPLSRLLVAPILTASLWAASSASAQTIAQWNFNSPVSDLNVGTGVMSASVPTNASSVQAIGGVALSMQSGDSESGSTDPTVGDDSALQITGFPAQGAASGTAGVEFAVSTVGFNAVQVSFDIRYSSTSPATMQSLYSLDGTSWVAGPQFAATLGGEQWYTRQTINLSAIAGAANNPNFRFRLVAAFTPSAGAAYTGAGGVYDPTGAWRLDMMSVTGAATAAIPPSGVATAVPSAVCTSGGQVLLRLPVNRGQNPNSSSLAVRANLSSLGGSATQSLFDNGANGDVTPNDRIYAFLYTVPAGQTPGLRTIPVTISDGQGRSATSNVSLIVADCSQPSAARVVISQVYGGGGNTPNVTGATSVFNADYIELYNRSAQPVQLDGWTVQYASPIDPLGFWDASETAALSGAIQPGQYMLVRCTVPNSLGSPLPTADFELRVPIGIGRSGGRVALVRSAALLGAACDRADVEDLVGYGGAASCFEGSAATGTTDDDTAAIRKLGGAQDTGQNFNDFVVSTPAPHNRASGGFLAGFASADRAGACAGGPLGFFVQVSGATTPPSTGLIVTADLSELGGSAATPLVDGGNGAFSLQATVGSSVLPGEKRVRLSVQDAQGRVDSSSMAVAVGVCVPSVSRVVIGQVYSGAGAINSPYAADFVELFNRSAAPVDTTGWSLQYAAADDPAGFNGLHQIALTGVIAPGGHLLVQAGAAGATGLALPIPDLVGSLGMDNEFGRLALATTLAPLGTACAGAAVEDLVGYGPTAVCHEGLASTPKLTNQRVARRRGDGCQDFDQNIIDFDVSDMVALPRNSASPPTPCGAPATGACCTGAVCAVVAATSCTGQFQGAGSACDAPGNPVTCCRANFDQVGGLSVQDIFAYLNAWFAGSAQADLDGNGLSVQDIFTFLNLWFSGC